MPPTHIRLAKLSDVNAITDIYNEAILTTTATFDIETKTPSDRQEWLESHGERHPVLVAEVDGQVVGWASLNPWSERPAYNGTAETSFYVKQEHRGRGIGRQLKAAILAEAQRIGFHTLIARMAEGADASMHLNESFGFVHIGVMKQVGFKFGQYLDVYIMQKMLSEE